MADHNCPFCALGDDAWFHSQTLARALWDRFPVAPGHALIVTRRHIPSWFDASAAERAAMLEAIDRVRAIIEQHHSPDGYNVGLNIGSAAGQTVDHLHLHVIPRYAGDVADPRGGIRHVLPGKGNYLVSTPNEELPHGRSLVRGADDDPLLPHLVAHLDHADEVDIAVAFTMTSGVRELEEHLRDVIARGGRVRFVTGDYLGVTEPDALLRLIDLGDRAELRIFESGGMSFHPKSYILRRTGGYGTAFVGSSNLSFTALKTGIEWNYRVVTSRDGQSFREVCDAFDLLFAAPQTRPLTADWVDGYRARRLPPAPPLTGVDAEPPLFVPPPNPIQELALEALTSTRIAGNAAGLVVLATGLGKTWLSAYDTERAKAERVLFVAHREEILDQAMRTYRTIRPHTVLGKYTGTEKSPDAAVLFASIQTLGRAQHLDRFAPDQFDYIIVDEFHHAAASTYRRLIDHFTPKFLLGLTATPERTDGASLLSLCGENLVYRCDLAEGIRRGLLAPFDYYGVPDEVDYENIPWRSNRFDEEELTTALATTSRAANALDQLRRRGGKRTLAFCVSQRHADFMKQYTLDAGLRVAAVHSGESSDPRTHSLERLQHGELDVLFAVDMFNEGVDLPDVDTILMLRPTESQILWLQQFGRGLRYRPEKRLKVIDYIGNHRSFLIKPRTLFQLSGGNEEIRKALNLLEAKQPIEGLPANCSVTYDLEAKNILRDLIGAERQNVGDRLRQYYEEFRLRTGFRPFATEAFHDGYDPASARTGYGSWFQFVRAMGDLTSLDDDAEVRLRPLLSALESTPMTKSFKMVVLLAMIAEDAFPGSVSIDRLVDRVKLIARRNAALRTEFAEALDDDALLRTLLEDNPIQAWTGGRGTRGDQYFGYDGSRFASAVSLPASLHESGAELVRELAEWRLARYLRRAGAAGAPRIVCKVSHTNGKPILFLPSRDRNAGIPEGWVEVSADGETYQAKFVKIAVNVMTRGASEMNVLPDLMHKWFGPNAGLPGTTFQVVFEQSSDGYILSPFSDQHERHLTLWERYTRAEVPKFFGFELKGFEAQEGIVTRPGLILLFVTLDKSGMVEQHRYEDAFLSPNKFRWQSQNRTTRDSRVGQMIQNHRSEGTHVHLFVRPTAKVAGKTQPFIFCGELEFERWEGDKPITVWWGLESTVPAELHAALRIRPNDNRR